MTRMRHPAILLVMLGITCLAARCSSSDGEDADSPSTLDPNVPPVTQGNWYRPSVAVDWQWQLAGALNTSYDVELYDVDLFDTPREVIDELHGRGCKVLCYFSAGSGENWRPDYAQFLGTDLGKPLEGWEGERWLDVRSQRVLDLMLARLNLAAERGCDGVEMDNVDAYANDSGFSLRDSDQLAYNRRLANEAHARSLAVALKNDGDQATALVDYFDFELNEECHAFDECGLLQVFLDRGKPVLNVEYADNLTQANALAATLCPVANAAGHRTLILPIDLDDSFRVSCY
jgi:hypothetical protein